MMQLFNLSFWIWFAQECSPAALTRAWFEDWQRVHGEKHTKDD